MEAARPFAIDPAVALIYDAGMARSFNPNDLIALPIVDADGAIALAKILESATLRAWARVAGEIPEGDIAVLRKPLTEWKSRSPRKKRGRDEEEASGGGSTTG